MNDRLKLNLLHAAPPYNKPISVNEITKEVYEADCIYVSILPIDLPHTSPSSRTDIKNQWLKTLPNLDNIKSLSIRLKANQEFFETVCEMKNLESLFIVTSSATNLGSLTKLKKLRRLHLGSFSQLTDISPLQKLGNLQILSIANSFKIENYDVIGKMENLIALGLYGDESSPKNLRLPSLKPYNNLKQLRHLDLSATSVIDNSYETLLEMENLERFDTLTTIKKDIREQIKKHPNLKAGSFIDWDWESKSFYKDKIW